MKFYWKWVWSTRLGSLYLARYCSEWDRRLRELLATYSHTAELRGHTLVLGGVCIWVGGQFYAYGLQTTSGVTRPSIRTMKRLAAVCRRLQEIEA